MKMYSDESLGQRDYNHTTCTQFGLWVFRHGNPCISRVFGPNLLWASNWHENAFTRVLRSTRSQEHDLHLGVGSGIGQIHCPFVENKLTDNPFANRSLISSGGRVGWAGLAGGWVVGFNGLASVFLDQIKKSVQIWTHFQHIIEIPNTDSHISFFTQFQIHTISSDFQNSKYSVPQISFIHKYTQSPNTKSPNTQSTNQISGEIYSVGGEPDLARIGLDLARERKREVRPRSEG